MENNKPDVWKYAADNAKPDCPMCKGTGTYMYDHNHGTVCKKCCQHGLGWWLLEKYYGENNGKLCCRAGCGATKENIE